MSNEDVVKGLTPLPCRTTTLKEAIALKPVDGHNNYFEGFVPRDWCTTHMIMAHGGFITTLIQAATKEYFRLRYPALSLPDALSVQVQFLRPVPGGVVFLHVIDVKIGRKMSVVRVELQSKNKEGNILSCTMALVMQGNLATEKGVTAAIPRNFSDIMPRREDCVRFGDAWWMNLIPITRKLRQWIPKGGPDACWNDRLGPGTRKTWVKMDDGTGFDTLFLGELCDAFLNVPTSFPPNQKEALKELLKFIYPTLSMTLIIRRDPKHAEWLFMLISSTGVKDGRYGIDVVILNEDGAVIAECKLVSQCVEVPLGLTVVGNSLKL